MKATIASAAGRIFARLASKDQPEPDSIFLSKQSQYSSYRIGDWSYGSPRVLSWNEGATLQVGRFCSLADGVTILLGGEHRTDWVTTYPFSVLFEEGKGFPGHPRTKGDVTVGNDVWIGAEAMVLSGVNIGDGAVIAARCVVTQDVAPYSVVAGNPGRHVKFRFPGPVIDGLLRIAWWNWPMEKILEALPLLLSPDIENFVDKYDPDDSARAQRRAGVKLQTP